MRVRATLHLVLALLWLPACPAMADAYGKNLLLLKKALRDGNCTQAYESAERLVQEDPRRPEGYLYLADALLCLDRPWNALLACGNYRTAGGEEDVESRLNRAKAALPLVTIAIRAFEAQPPGDFSRLSEFRSVPLSVPPDDTCCTIAGVEEELQGLLVEDLAHGYRVRVPPWQTSTITIDAEGFQRSVLRVEAGSPGTKGHAIAELRKEAANTAGVWLYSTVDRYRARLLVGGEARHDLTTDSIWIPPGEYEVSVTPAGLPDMVLLQEPMSVDRETTRSVDVTGPAADELDRLHGDVGMASVDRDYRVELHWLLPGHDGRTTELAPGEAVHVLAGRYRVLLSRVVHTADGVGDPVVVLDREEVLDVRTDRQLRLPTDAMRAEAEQGWLAALRVKYLPGRSVLRLDGRLVGMPDASGEIRVSLDPGPHELNVVAPWHERWDISIRLESREYGTAVFDAKLLAEYEKSRKMRRIGTFNTIVGGASLLAAIVVGAMAEVQYQTAIQADLAYHDLDTDDDADFRHYDALRREHASHYTGLATLAGILTGVGGTAASVGITIHIVAPRDPNLPALRTLWGKLP